MIKVQLLYLQDKPLVLEPPPTLLVSVLAWGGGLASGAHEKGDPNVQPR